MHRPKAGFWIRLCVAILYPLGGLLFRIRWRNLDRMPATGGVIIVINHVSHIDTILMARLVWQTGRVPRFMIKNTVFDKPVLGQIMRGAKQIPVYRGTADAAKSLDAAIQALRDGEAVVIYPEGTITRDPKQWPMQAKTGLARLVMLVPDIPVVPIGQWGAQKTSRRRWLTRRPVEASIGRPMDMTKYPSELSLDTLRAITDDIMRAVRDLVAEVRGEDPPEAFYRPSGKTQAG
ncbi:MAG: 1-acyl-sn-glycerol-3-phosphate acyltransferase [Actinobacteria bacterium]|nr:1-acyl-sn-glycerol-3-phosphate acyltransferase [Actinomycetota bacterium]